MTHNRETNWRTADKRDIKVKDMEVSHLVNVLNWISDNRESYTSADYELMEAEAKYRQTILFAEGKEYPQLVDQRWRVVNPVTGKSRIDKPPADYVEAVKDNAAYQAMAARTQKRRK